MEAAAQAAARRARPDAARRTTRIRCRDSRSSTRVSSHRRARPVQPWQYAPVTDDQLRNPLNLIPPDQRPRVILRFSDQRDLLVSGLLDGGTDIAQRPAVVDSPMEKGHVVLFANNPVYRGETIGSYFMVFNTIMNFDNLNAGRKLDAK